MENVSSEQMLTAMVAARLEIFLDDMRATELHLEEKSVLILVDVVEMTHVSIDLDYLVDILAIQEVRNLINAPRGRN